MEYRNDANDHTYHGLRSVCCSMCFAAHLTSLFLLQFSLLLGFYLLLSSSDSVSIHRACYVPQLRIELKRVFTQRSQYCTGTSTKPEIRSEWTRSSSCYAQRPDMLQVRTLGSNYVFVELKFYSASICAIAQLAMLWAEHFGFQIVWVLCVSLNGPTPSPFPIASMYVYHSYCAIDHEQNMSFWNDLGTFICFYLYCSACDLLASFLTLSASHKRHPTLSGYFFCLLIFLLRAMFRVTFEAVLLSNGTD